VQPLSHAQIEANAALSQLLEATGVGYWEYDHLADRVSFSNKLRDWLGNDFPALAGSGLRDWFARIHPEDRASVEAAVRNAIDTDAAFITEYRFAKADGNWLWLHARGHVAERDAEGQALRSIGIKTDITDRKQQEELFQLQQAFNQVLLNSPNRETLYTGLLDTVLRLSQLDGGGIYIIRPDGGYHLVASQGIGADFLAEASEIEPDSSRAQILDAGRTLCSCIDGGPACTHLETIRLPNFQAEGITALLVLPVSENGRISASLNLASKHVRSMPVVVTRFLETLVRQFGQALERLTAQETAQQERLNLDGFFQAITDFVFVLDEQARILHFNPAVKTRLGYDDSLLGQSILAVHPQRVHAEAMQVVGEMLAGQRESCPLPLRHADGSEIMVDTRIVRGTWGGQPALLGISRDISALVETRNQLERERGFLKTLVQTIPDLVWLKDPRGVYLACNPRFEQMYGASEAEIIGKTDYDFVDAARADFFRANDHAAAMARQPRINEEWLSFAKGGYRGLFETTKTAMLTAEGDLIGVLGIAHDITVAREADNRRRQLMEISRDGIAIVNQDHQVIDANQRFAEMLGYSEAEVLGLHTWDYESNLSEAQVREQFADLSNISVTFESRHRRKDGSFYEVEVSATGTSINGSNVVITVTRDISARKAAERALHDSEERFHNLFDSMSEGVALHEMLFDAAGTAVEYQIVEVNTAFQSILGIDPVNVLGHRSCEAYGVDAPPYLHEFAEVVAQRRPIQFESWFAPLQKYFSISVTPWRDNGFATIFTDITERKHADQALRESEERLSSLFKQAADGIVLIDAETLAFAEFNDAACQALGYSRDEFAQLELSKINTTFTPQLLREAIDSIVATGERDFETIHLHKDGSPRNVEISNRVVRTKGRTYVVAIWTDITQRKAADIALREAELRWKFALEGSGLGVWDWNVATGEIFFSPLWLNMIGYLPGEIANNFESFSSLLHPEDKAHLLSTVQGYFNAETPDYVVDFRMRHQAGGWKWIQARGLLVARDADDQPLRMIGVHVDIDQRKQAEEKLRASENALRLAQQVAQIGSWQLDIRTQQLQWSDETYRIFGIPQGEPLTIDNFVSVIHPDDRDAVVLAWNAALLGDPYDIEHRIVVNGVVYWVRERAQIKIDGNKAISGIGTVQDITQRKQDQALLAESEERYRILADYSPDWQYWLGVDGRYLYVSPGCESISGFTPQDFISDSRLMLSIIHPDDREVWLKHWDNKDVAALQHLHSLMQFRIINKDGQLRWIEHQCQAVHSVTAEYRGRRGVNRDITERKRFQVELEAHREHLEALVEERTTELVAARKRAEDASRSKSTFLANMSHEIRTPMNAIIGLTHLLRKTVTLPKQAEQLDKVAEAARHLLGIINDVLDISKIEAGKMTIEIEDFSLEQVIDEVINLLREKSAAKQLSLTSRIDPDLPRILRGDALRLGQVLLNLANNAVKFTEHGGVRIHATQVERNDDLVRLRFEISDSGIGMSEEQLSRLFTAFEQADTSTTRKYGGTGLGLVISKRLINLMGGTLDSDIGVISHPGQGSEFWFEIPFFIGTSQQLPARPQPLDARKLLASRHGARILLAEDNQVNQEVALELLHEAGLRADVAEDGLEALRMMDLTPYDLVLMDMQMPRMDGLTATRAIREIPRFKRIPILAMTANAFEEDRLQCQAAGMDDHIAKPVDPDTLYAALLKWLPENLVSPPSSVSTPVFTAPLSNQQTAAIQAIPGLDSAAGLQRMRGKWASYERLLRLYADSHHTDMALLRERFAAGEYEEARRIAHSLKGASGSLGAEGVRTLATELELAIRNSASNSEIERLSIRVEETHNELVAALHSALTTSASLSGETDRIDESVLIDAATHQTIADLERLLGEDDLAAADAYRIARPILAHLLTENAQQRLARQIGSYNFQSALETLRERHNKS